MDKVIKEVLKRQKKSKLSNTKFAAKLGIPRQTWESLITGRRNAGYKVWSAIQSTYPELTDMVIADMESRLLKAGKITNGEKSK